MTIDSETRKLKKIESAEDFKKDIKADYSEHEIVRAKEQIKGLDEQIKALMNQKHDLEMSQPEEVRNINY